MHQILHKSIQYIVNQKSYMNYGYAKNNGTNYYYKYTTNTTHK